MAANVKSNQGKLASIDTDIYMNKMSVAHYIADIPPPQHFKPKGWKTWYDFAADRMWERNDRHLLDGWVMYGDANDNEDYSKRAALAVYWVYRFNELQEIMGRQ
jgi:hypothetical protein